MVKKTMNSDKGLPKAPRGGPKGSKRPSREKRGVQHDATWTPRGGGGPPQGEFKGLNYYQDSGIHRINGSEEHKKTLNAGPRVGGLHKAFTAGPRGRAV